MALAYHLDYTNKSFVYATYSEFMNISKNFIIDFKYFCRDADLFVIDTQYTFEEATQKEDWRHSSALAAINIAADSNVSSVFLFHYGPNRNDEELKICA